MDCQEACQEKAGNPQQVGWLLERQSQEAENFHCQGHQKGESGAEGLKLAEQACWLIAHFFFLLMCVEMLELPENRVKVELLPKQHDFLFCEAKEKMYDGAFGAGKSRVLAYNAALKAQYPGNVVGLFRKTFTSLRYTTLKVLLEKDGHLPPVLPLGSYKHNKSEHRIKVHQGGEIIYMGFDDPLRIASLNLGSAFVDEAREIEEDEYTMLLGRLRNTADPLRQLGLATNPDAPSHFLYKRFYKDKDNTRAVFKSKSTDNFFLPQDYIDMLSKFTGQYRDRFVLGKWVAFEGLIYDNFSRDVHLVHRELSEFKWFLLSVDEGYKDPAVIGLWGIDSDNRMHLLRMFYKRQVLPSRVIQTLQFYGMTLIAQLRPEDMPVEKWEVPQRIFVFDPAAAGLRADAENKGLDCRAANNAVFEGNQCVRDFLAIDTDGRPGMTIEPEGEGVEDWLTEVESYHLDKNEKPAKGLDHAMDMTRYAAMFLKENVIEPRLLSLEPEKKQEKDETQEEREELLFNRQQAWN